MRVEAVANDVSRSASLKKSTGACYWKRMGGTKYSQLDLIFWSAGFGWTHVFFRVDDHVEKLSITEIYNDPQEAVAQATVQLIEGSVFSTVLWLDEPGTYALELRRVDRSPTIRGKFREFKETFLDQIPLSAVALREFEFTTHLEYWAALVATGLSRTAVLAKHRLYPWRPRELKRGAREGVCVPSRELGIIEKFLHRRPSRRE